MQQPELDVRSICSFHDRFLVSPGEPAEQTPIARWIAENHRCNTELWRADDRARRDDVPAAEIVRCKRSIDRHNQQRNDAVEAIDACLLEALKDVRRAADARPSSETPGAMIDRLSILSLKIHHMGLQAKREEAGKAHMDACRAKLERLVEQRTDLATCLDRLLAECRRGEAFFKVYRQFKMYNDPALNPELYRGGSAPG